MRKIIFSIEDDTEDVEVCIVGKVPIEDLASIASSFCHEICEEMAEAANCDIERIYKMMDTAIRMKGDPTVRIIKGGPQE